MRFSSSASGAEPKLVGHQLVLHPPDDDGHDPFQPEPGEPARHGAGGPFAGDAEVEVAGVGREGIDLVTEDVREAAEGAARRKVAEGEAGAFPPSADSPDAND